MNSDNPYQPPGTSLETVTSESDDIWAYVEPQSVPIGRGLSWIGEGFRFFRQDWGVWIGITIIYLMILVFSSFVPFAANVLQPILAGGLMLGIFAQDRGEPLEIRHMFDGFNVQVDKLAILGALMIGLGIIVAIITIIFILIGVLIGVAMEKSGSSPGILVGIFLLIGIPIFFVIFAIFGAVAWFGPPLIVLQERSVGDAFKASLLALKRNIGPFIIFTIFAIIMVFFAIITFYLGFLVVLPVLFGATYASWKDVFTRAPTY